uniref:DNA repair protein XRCC3 homolog n=1 Tax=Tanacetum cinerariifolium TaxID=118510 RepID=A0A6L2MBS2_TANCI|nr:DNA repair protein XRCC3 homolog [Tanacetum cinerariifolium]
MKPQNLLIRPPPTQFCTLGYLILDAFLGGGIPTNSITELVSKSGCGKTQLSLQLFTSQLLTTLNGSSLYLYSGFPFPYRRFAQLVKSFQSTHLNLFQSARDPRDHVFTREVHDVRQLFDIISHLSLCLENKETKLDVKMIVIDSIATLFRSEFENNASDLKKRCDLFLRISVCLEGIAKRFGVAVVVMEHVVDLMDDEGQVVHDFKAAHEVLVKHKGLAGEKYFEKVMERLVRARRVNMAVRLFKKMEIEYGFVMSLDKLKFVVEMLCEHGYVSSAEKLVKSVANEFFSNEFICNGLVKGWCVDGKLDEARRLSQEIYRGGFEIGVVGYNTILDYVCRLCRKKDPFRMEFVLEN